MLVTYFHSYIVIINILKMCLVIFIQLLCIIQVKTETDVTQENIQKVLDDINVIESKLKTLQTGFLKNVRDANEVKSEASTLIQEVEDTEKKASQLLASYREASNKLDTRAQIAKTTKYNSQNLLEKASQLSANTTLKLRELGGKEIQL